MRWKLVLFGKLLPYHTLFMIIGCQQLADSYGGGHSTMQRGVWWNAHHHNYQQALDMNREWHTPEHKFASK